MWIEVIGILSTLMILISMCFNTVSFKGNVAMRIANLIGSIGFTIYGFILPAYSTGVLNACLIFINAYHLIKLLKLNKTSMANESQNAAKVEKNN